MKPGDCIIGEDGTAYLVVRVGAVQPDQFRWWVEARERHMPARAFDGPPWLDLHLDPARESEQPIAFGLVLP